MKENNPYTIPLAIIVAGIIIAGAIIYTFGGPAQNGLKNPDDSTAQATKEETAKTIRSIQESDHVRGPKDASLILVEYSDLECPYCKTFHETLMRIVNEYPNDVVWVYRHFPLQSIHPKAVNEAVASECAAQQGGNDAFWAFIDEVFRITPSNNGLDLSKLPTIAQKIGIDVDTFNSCLENGGGLDKISDDVQEIVGIGGTGTPHSIIITKDGRQIPVKGAQTYTFMKSLIDSLLQE